VLAHKNKNFTLESHLDHGTTYLLKTTKTLAVQRANFIKDHLQSNLGILTNISAADIDEISNAIAAYDNLKEQPISNKQARSAASNYAMPEALAKAFKAIEHMNILMRSYFGDTNKTMVEEFALSSQILSTGIHHTGIEGLVTQDGLPLANATVQIAGTDKVTKTDLEGHYIISKIKAGDYTVEASNASGEKVSKLVHVSQGHTEALDLTF